MGLSIVEVWATPAILCLLSTHSFFLVTNISPLVCQSISTLETHWIHWLNLVLLWNSENTCWLTSSHSFLTCCLPLIGRLAPHLRLLLSSHYFLLLLITRTSFIIIVTHWAGLVPHWLLPRQVGQALVLSRPYVIIAYSTRYSSTGFELCIGCISISICSSNVIAVARVACRIWSRVYFEPSCHPPNPNYILFGISLIARLIGRFVINCKSFCSGKIFWKFAAASDISLSA